MRYCNDKRKWAEFAVFDDKRNTCDVARDDGCPGALSKSKAAPKTRFLFRGISLLQERNIHKAPMPFYLSANILADLLCTQFLSTGILCHRQYYYTISWSVRTSIVTIISFAASKLGADFSFWDTRLLVRPVNTGKRCFVSCNLVYPFYLTYASWNYTAVYSVYLMLFIVLIFCRPINTVCSDISCFALLSMCKNYYNRNPNNKKNSK